MKISFSPPDIGDKEIEYVSEVLRSGWITTGPKTKELERKLSEYLGTARTVCLNSQTACAETVLRILGIGEGDEVIVPAYTYTASASVICHVGARPVFVDSSKDSLEMDYDKMAEAVTERTKAVIPVMIGGVPVDYERIIKVLEEKRNLFKARDDDSIGSHIQKAVGRAILVADGAHALGAEYKGKKIGQFADFTTFSFHAVKNLTTAEGGAFTWNPDSIKDKGQENGKDSPENMDDAIYKTAMLLSLHGQDKDAFSKDTSGSWEYDIKGTYYKCNMTDIMAALGLAQLERYDGMLKRRHEIIRRYDEAFKPLGMRSLPHVTDKHKGSGHLYISMLPEKAGETVDERMERRNRIISEMGKEGVPLNVHYKPLPMMTAYKELGYDIKDFPNAFAHFTGEITIPLHTLLTDEEVEYIIEKMKAVLEKNK